MWKYARLRYYLFLSCAFLLSLLFSRNIMDAIRSHRDAVSLLRLDSTEWNDLGFGTMAALLSAAFAAKRVRLSLPIGFCIAVVTALWIAARTTSAHADLTFFKSFSNLAYGDAFAVPIITLIITNLIKHSPSSTVQSKNERILTETPITTKDEDSFGFLNIVADVASFIHQNKPIATRTIGIHGTWGSGKTSFLNLVREHLKKDSSQVRFIDFTPWHSSEEPFTAQLLNKLIFELDPKEHKLKRDLQKYADALAELSVSGKLLKWLYPPESNSTEDIRKSINEALISSKLTYVIVIDDLDRLGGNEILEVLKLIRSTADFHGMYYMLAYDRTEINSILQTEGITNPKFLDKFVELEIGLPHITPRQLGDFLVQHIELGAQEEERKRLETALFGPLAQRLDYSALVSTPRDAKRLALSTNVFYHRVQKDVELCDAVLVQMLRMRFPSQLELFARDFSRFLENRQGHGLRHPLVLKKEGGKLAIEVALENEATRGTIDDSGRQRFISVLQRLFPEHHGYKDGFNRIHYSDSFYRYFTYFIDSTAVSEHDLQNILNGEEAAHLVAQRIVEQDQELSLALRLEYASSQANRWRVVSILLALGRASTAQSGRNVWAMTLGRHTGWLRTQLVWSNYAVDDKINPKEQKRFRKLLNEGTYPYGFERDLLQAMYGETSGDSFLLPRKEIKMLLLHFIEQVIDNETSMNIEVYSAIADCHVREWIPQNDNSWRSKHAWFHETRQFLDTCLHNFGTTAYCSWFLEDKNRFEITNQFAVHEAARDIYGSWQDFEDHLKSLPQDDPAVAELVSLYNKFKEAGFTGSIDFKPRILSRPRP